MSAVSIQRQAERIELQLMGEEARLESVSRNPKWPVTDLEQKRSAIAELKASLATMLWLRDNEARIKTALARGGGA